jgi:hypothetical protein
VRAGEEIERFRESARECITDTLALLDGAPDSDAWFQAGMELHRVCWLVGSATHCLREWAEPDDARRDDDKRSGPGDSALSSEERGRVRWLRCGRREVWRWTASNPLG